MSTRIPVPQVKGSDLGFGRVRAELVCVVVSGEASYYGEVIGADEALVPVWIG